MITIINSPQKIVPVYNPIYSKVSSDKTAEESFNFLFDVYVNGVFVTRDKLLPRPGTTQTIYSPARVLESYVSYDLTNNLYGEQQQENCARDFKIVYGEEYVNYLGILQLKKDTITSTDYTIVRTLENHNYILGDTILIKDIPSPYQRYNAIHTVVAVIDSKNVLINKSYNTSYPTTISTSGKVTYADKRKTVYIADKFILLNGTTFAGNDWDVYGPDGCNVECKVFPDNRMRLVVPDVTCSTAGQQITHQSIVLTPGRKYKVQLNISDINNPSGAPVDVYARLGVVDGVIYNSIGVYDEIITASGGNDFAIVMDLRNADTAGFGTHSITLSDIELIELQPYFEGKFINTVLSYEKYPYWDYTQKGIGVGTNKPFLTNSPKTLKVKLDDVGSISWLNLKVNGPEVYQMLVDVVDLVGGTTQYLFDLYSMSSDVDINNTILHFPTHPVSINNGMYGVIIDNTTDYYALAIVKDSVIISKVRTYEISKDCSKFEPVQFMFLNSFGTFDFYTCTLLGRTNINVTRDSYTKTLDFGYALGDRGKTTINVNANESFIINTDWVSEETANWLCYEMFLSTEIYIVTPNARPIPIQLDTNTIEVKKRVNDKLLNYQFNYSKALPINTARN